MLDQKRVVGSDLRTPSTIRQTGCACFSFFARKKAPLHVPLIGSSSPRCRAAIDQKLQNGPVAAVGHQVGRHQFDILPSWAANRLQIAGSEWDVFFAVEKIMSGWGAVRGSLSWFCSLLSPMGQSDAGPSSKGPIALCACASTFTPCALRPAPSCL